MLLDRAASLPAAEREGSLISKHFGKARGHANGQQQRPRQPLEVAYQHGRVLCSLKVVHCVSDRLVAGANRGWDVSGGYAIHRILEWDCSVGRASGKRDGTAGVGRWCSRVEGRLSRCVRVDVQQLEAEGGVGEGGGGGGGGAVRGVGRGGGRKVCANHQTCFIETTLLCPYAPSSPQSATAGSMATLDEWCAGRVCEAVEATRSRCNGSGQERLSKWRCWFAVRSGRSRALECSTCAGPRPNSRDPHHSPA